MKILIAVIACLLINVVWSAPATQEAQDNSYSVTIKDDGEEKEEIIIIDEEKNVEIFQSVGSDDAEIVEDFDTGLEGIIPKKGDSCYVRPLNSDENSEPADLKAGIENAKSQNDVPETKGNADDYYTLAGNPIKNPAVVGQTIADKCEGRNIYWLKSLPHGDSGRDKRGCYRITYCTYTYLGGGWWYRRCRWVIRCF